jgi:small subunit ribosomal protein S1
LVKEDGKKLSKGDEAEFKIIEFNKDLKRVVASHTAIFKEEEERNVKAARKKASVSDEAKPTLGDANEQLQALKDKMEASSKGKK